MEISTLNDLRREVSESFVQIQIDCYSLSYDDLLESITHDYLELLRDKFDFKWGDEIPEIEADEWWNLFKKYDKVEGKI